MKIPKKNLLAMNIAAQSFYEVFCFLKSDFDKNKGKVNEICPSAMVVNGIFALELYLKLYYAMLKCDPDIEIEHINNRNIVGCTVYKLENIPPINQGDLRVKSIKCNLNNHNYIESNSGHDLKVLYDLCILEDRKEILINHVFHGKDKVDIEHGLFALRDKFIKTRYFFEIDNTSGDKWKITNIDILEFTIKKLNEFFSTKVYFADNTQGALILNG